MTRIYTRIPEKVSGKGTIYRVFNGLEEKIQVKEIISKIKEKGVETKQFTLNKLESKTKFLDKENTKINWAVGHAKDQRNHDFEVLKVDLKSFKPIELGAIWLPKNQYRPGDTIRGYIFLRKKNYSINATLQLLSEINDKEVILELIDNSDTIIKAIPLSNPNQPIIFFEIEIAKYHSTGIYKLQLKKENDILSQISINVDLYDKPDIEIFIDIPNWILLGEESTAIIHAKYFHGEPVSNGSIVLSSSSWNGSIKKDFLNGTGKIKLPEMDLGSHEIHVELEDENNRTAKTKKLVVVSEEPFKLELFKEPESDRIAANQPLQIRIKVTDPVGKPLSQKTVETSLLNWKHEEQLEKTIFSTDKLGYVVLPVVELTSGSYSFTAKISEFGLSVKVNDKFIVQNPSDDDIWIEIRDVPDHVHPDEKITGKIILRGPGFSEAKINEIFIDLISDQIVESRKIDLPKDPANIKEIPFTFDIPVGYNGKLALEAYLNPVIAENYDQSVKKPPSDWIGDVFTFSKTTAKKIVEVPMNYSLISFESITDEHIATGTDFEININFKEIEPSTSDIWLGIALTDERVLLEYQPVQLDSVFKPSIDAVNILTLGSVEMPLYGLAMEVGRAARGFRPDRLPRFQSIMGAGKRGSSIRMAKMADFADINDFSPLDDMPLESPIETRENEEDLTQNIIRTEFPEDIVLQPIKIKEKSHKVAIKSPDSITRYKIYLLACTPTQYGVVEKEIVVKNPVFTSTLNPPELTLQDNILLPVIVENLSNKTLKKIQLSVQGNECLKILDNKNQIIDILNPKEKKNVYWNVKAINVGDAGFSTLLEVGKFKEFSELQKPLRISPPGLPFIEFTRSRLEAEYPWIQEVVVTEDEVFTLGIINFLPGLELALIEGVESLASYPYGCCEQTSASTIPNALAYRYLETNKKLTDEVKAKLIKNMQAGLERYIKIFRSSEGGFGLWDGNNPSVFHTALALSVLGKIMEFVNVSESIFKDAKNFLSKNQREDGAYIAISGVHRNFPSTLNDIAMTAYVAHSQALGGISDIKAINWLIDQIDSQEFKDDSTIIALLLDTLMMRKNDIKANTKDKIPIIINKLLQNVVQDEKGAHWSKGSSLSSEVETTAYALVALSHTDGYSGEILNIFEAGANFLLNTRSSSGWYTTRDTLWATMALGEIASSLEQKAVDGTLIVKLNGDIVVSEKLNKENKYYKIYDVRNIFLDKFVRGKNLIEVFIEGIGAGHIVLETRKWYPVKPKEDLEIQIKQKIENNKKGEYVISYNIEANDMIEAVMLEQPIPAGFQPQNGLIESLKLTKEIEHVEINKNNISCFISEFRSTTISYTFDVTIKGSISLNGLRILPMYQPELITNYETKKLEI